MPELQFFVFNLLCSKIYLSFFSLFLPELSKNFTQIISYYSYHPLYNVQNAYKTIWKQLIFVNIMLMNVPELCTQRPYYSRIIRTKIATYYSQNYVSTLAEA